MTDTDTHVPAAGTSDHDRIFVAGRWQPSAGDSRIIVRSPVDGSEIGSVPDGSTADIDAAVAAARAAFDDPAGWAHWTPSNRAEVLERFAAALEDRSSAIATSVSRQNGMPISTSNAIEAVFPALLLRYYAGLARDEIEERRDAMFGGTTLIARDPIGVVAAVVPWNFPQALAFMKIAPALSAGCTVVLKPAPETVLDAVDVAEAAIAAGLPPGVLNIVPAGREVGHHLVSHPGVDKVAFTGSTAAGRTIAETCGRLLRPVTLELGGKSAAVVLDDADLASLGEDFVAATLTNNGQTCYLSTRILAPRSRYTEVVDAVSDLAGGLRVGDPLDPTTHVGPLVSGRQHDRVRGYVDKARAEGGRITVGGDRPAGFDGGYYYSPTVIADVGNHDTIAREEVFGPVLAVIAYDDEQDAIRLANDTEYGLGGSVWSSDPHRALAVARRMTTGSVGLNSYVNDPASPFGGVKASGLGAELGPESLNSYRSLKAIYQVP